MITIRGNTYPVREQLKALGARYSPQDGWRLTAWTNDTLANLRALPGISFDTPEKPVAPTGTLPAALYPYQRAGAMALADHAAFLLADAPGVGKTPQALAAAAYVGKPALALVPASMQPQWRREQQRWAPDLNLEIASWGKVPDVLPKGATLIVDEAHYGKTLKAARTKKFLKLANDAERTWLLTGTPLLNRPEELFTLLKAMRHPLGTSWFRFVMRYCAAQKTNFGLDTSGASHLDELRERLADIMLRRTIDEVLPELPPLRRSLCVVDAPESAQALVCAEASLVRGRTLREVRARPEDFAEIARLRKEMATSKAPLVADMVDHTPTIVWYWHKEAVRLTHNALIERGIKSVAVTGDTSPDDRQKAVDAFQAGEVTAFVATMGSCGVGLTLTKARRVLFGELAWTPNDITQAEARARRFGQTEAVLVDYVVYNNSLDGYIGQMILEKAEVIGQLIEGNRWQL